MSELLILAYFIAWVGHACIWTSILNNLYGQRLSKIVLKPWRLLTGFIILVFPLLICAYGLILIGLYIVACFVVGCFVLPVITLVRLLRKPPLAVISDGFTYRSP